jgi:hypothetical protein
VANPPLEKSTDNITDNGWQTYSFKKGWAESMLNMNLELSMDVDENIKLEPLEVGSQKQTDSKYLRVRQGLSST